MIAGLGGALGFGLKIPAGGLLVPMTIGAALEALGLVTITLPQWLLAMGYAFLGWSVGLGFTRDILIHASRVLPQILLSICAVIGICALFAFILVKAAGIDPMTAYLATCPGGVDSVAIIGASSHADLSFIMTLQTLRLLIVLLAGPALAKTTACLQGAMATKDRRGACDPRKIRDDFPAAGFTAVGAERADGTRSAPPRERCLLSHDAAENDRGAHPTKLGRGYARRGSYQPAEPAAASLELFSPPLSAAT
jgi:membrane AbrB-like protein